MVVYFNKDLLPVPPLQSLLPSGTGAAQILRQAQDTRLHFPPPPPRVQEPPCARTAPWFRGRIFHITFFCQGNGFFMVLVDVGHLFRCAGQYFMCVATGPPIRGDPISQSQSHIPLKPLPPALDPFPEATSP